MPETYTTGFNCRNCHRNLNLQVPEWNTAFVFAKSVTCRFCGDGPVVPILDEPK